MSTNYQYRAERFTSPPTGRKLSHFASEGWRLVSVTVDLDQSTSENYYVAYLERPATEVEVSGLHPRLFPKGKDALKLVASVA